MGNSRWPFVTSGLGLALLVWGSVWGLLYAPREVYMGDVQRIMYVHVPTRLERNAGADLRVRVRRALAAARRLGLGRPLEAAVEGGVVLSALLCTQGSIWARPTWGVWWDWDPRLTTTAVLLFAFAGILALRQFVDDPSSAPSGRRSRW
jgi:heme exporter protein C